MINIARKLPINACPVCHNTQYIIAESQLNYFLTDNYGEIIDFEEGRYTAKAKCLVCNHIIDMIPTKDNFIPSTPIRKLLYKEPEEKINNIKNPMERGN